MIEIVQKDVLFHVPDEELCRRLHITPDSAMFERALEWREEVAQRIRPVYIVKEVALGERTDQGLYVDDLHMNSKIIASKVKDEKAGLLYIASCGPEIAAYMETLADPLDVYMVDCLAQLGCYNAREQMFDVLCSEHGLGRYIVLSPGSIIDWSVADVKKFFRIFGGMYQQIGIRVLDSGLIDPLKSTSGIIVRSEEEFESCDLCMQPHCPSRRTPFDQDKYDAAMNL